MFDWIWTFKQIKEGFFVLFFSHVKCDGSFLMTMRTSCVPVQWILGLNRKNLFLKGGMWEQSQRWLVGIWTSWRLTKSSKVVMRFGPGACYLDLISMVKKDALFIQISMALRSGQSPGCGLFHLFIIIFSVNIPLDTYLIFLTAAYMWSWWYFVCFFQGVWSDLLGQVDHQNDVPDAAGQILLPAGWSGRFVRISPLQLGHVTVYRHLCNTRFQPS